MLASPQNPTNGRGGREIPCSGSETRLPLHRRQQRSDFHENQSHFSGAKAAEASSSATPEHRSVSIRSRRRRRITKLESRDWSWVCDCGALIPPGSDVRNRFDAIHAHAEHHRQAVAKTATNGCTVDPLPEEIVAPEDFPSRYSGSYALSGIASPKWGNSVKIDSQPRGAASF